MTDRPWVVNNSPVISGPTHPFIPGYYIDTPVTIVAFLYAGRVLAVAFGEEGALFSAPLAEFSVDMRWMQPMRWVVKGEEG